MAALLAASASGRDRVVSLACVALPSCALLAYTTLVRIGGAPAAYHMREAQLLQAVANPRVLISLVMHSAASTCLYVGLFMMPMVPLLARARNTPATIAAVAGLAASAVYVVKYAVRMPLLGNVLHDVGLGPVLVARADLWPHASASAWIVVTIAAAVGAALVLYAFTSHVKAVWMWSSSGCRDSLRCRLCCLHCAVVRGRLSVRSISRGAVVAHDRVSDCTRRVSLSFARNGHDEPRCRRCCCGIRYGCHERSVFIQPRPLAGCGRCAESGRRRRRSRRRIRSDGRAAESRDGRLEPEADHFAGRQTRLRARVVIRIPSSDRKQSGNAAPSPAPTRRCDEVMNT